MSSQGEHRPESIEVQLGRLSGFMERARDDRRELKDALDRLNEGQDAMRLQLAAVQQTASSTATAMAQLTAEKHGQRLDELERQIKELIALPGRVDWAERRVKAWDRWIGSGRAFCAKLILGVVTSGAFAAMLLRWAFGFRQGVDEISNSDMFAGTKDPVRGVVPPNQRGF